MRRLNTCLAAAILLLFLIHGVEGSFQLMGLRGVSPVLKGLSFLLLLLVLIHAAIGLKLTADTRRITKKTGVSYRRENAMFLARRISGFAILFLLLFHVAAYRTTGSSPDTLRLPVFDRLKLSGQVLLVLSVAVHLLTGTGSMLTGLGFRRGRAFLPDLLLALSVLLLFMGAAVLVYYFRWNG